MMEIMSRRRAKTLFDSGITYGQMQNLINYVQLNCDLSTFSHLNKSFTRDKMLQIFINAYKDENKDMIMPYRERLGAVNLLREFGGLFEAANSIVEPRDEEVNDGENQ